MNLTRDRLRSIGWFTLLTVCLALTSGLMLRVNAVKSEVHQAERRILGARHEIAFLETEYQTRSNQQQLKALNDVEFGYSAPRAQQYIEGERQLAVLGKPRAPGAPAPIRVAALDVDEVPASFVAMVSPVPGARQGSGEKRPARNRSEPDEALPDLASPARDPIAAAIAAESLGDRLARITPTHENPAKAQ